MEADTKHHNKLLKLFKDKENLQKKSHSETQQKKDKIIKEFNDQ